MSDATIPGAPGGNGADTVHWNGTAWVKSSAGATANAFYGQGNTGDSHTDTTGLPVFADGRGGNDTLSSGTGNDILIGSAGNDSLSAGGGADTLFGGSVTVGGTLGTPTFSGFADTGTDTLAGGAGNDTYILYASGDTVSEGAGQGTDTVLIAGTGLTSHTLAANVENLGMLDPATTVGRALTGNSGANQISGGAGNDTIAGGSGADTLDGGAGNDVISGTFSAERLIGGGGADSLVGDGGNDTLLGGDGNDTMVATYGSDSLDGGLGNDSIDGGGANDTILGGAGTDTINGFDGSDSIDGGLGADSLFGGNNNDTIIGNSGDTIDGSNGADSITASGTGLSIDSGADNDTITVAAGTTGTISGGFGSDVLAFSDHGTVTIAGTTVTAPGGMSFTASGIESLMTRSGPVAFADGTFVVCFAAGTRILTAAGEVAVEALRPGDLVATVSGQAAPMQPVVFLGRRRILLAGHPNAEELSPVRIRAGALGENTPHRDLLVSPDHCLFLDGWLVPARLLVNGTSVTVERNLAEVTYFHIELPAHDVVIAEGAAAESWLDAGNRAWFENAPTALLRVNAPQDAYATAEPTPCAAVIQAGPRLALIRDTIALRAAQPMVAGPARHRVA